MSGRASFIVFRRSVVIVLSFTNHMTFRIGLSLIFTTDDVVLNPAFRTSITILGYTSITDFITGRILVRNRWLGVR